MIKNLGLIILMNFFLTFRYKISSLSISLDFMHIIQQGSAASDGDIIYTCMGLKG